MKNINCLTTLLVLFLVHLCMMESASAKKVTHLRRKMVQSDITPNTNETKDTMPTFDGPPVDSAEDKATVFSGEEEDPEEYDNYYGDRPYYHHGGYPYYHYPHYYRPHYRPYYPYWRHHYYHHDDDDDDDDDD